MGKSSSVSGSAFSLVESVTLRPVRRAPWGSLFSVSASDTNTIIKNVYKKFAKDVFLLELSTVTKILSSAGSIILKF